MTWRYNTSIIEEVLENSSPRISGVLNITIIYYDLNWIRYNGGD